MFFFFLHFIGLEFYCTFYWWACWFFS
jgi:hypothetical protein